VKLTKLLCCNNRQKAALQKQPGRELLKHTTTPHSRTTRTLMQELKLAIFAIDCIRSNKTLLFIAEAPSFLPAVLSKRASSPRLIIPLLTLHEQALAVIMQRARACTGWVVERLSIVTSCSARHCREANVACARGILGWFSKALSHRAA
jgi:hypothetical protein